MKNANNTQGLTQSLINYSKRGSGGEDPSRRSQGSLGAEPLALNDFGDLLLKYSIFRHISGEIQPKNFRNLFITVRLCTGT